MDATRYQDRKAMKVSVAMPVYNAAPYLQETLESLFAQTFTDLEIIAVDDKSTDGSLAMLRSITDPRLKVIALDENLGHPGATRVAFDHAQGQYVVRCDADDLCHPERIARQVAFMDAHPEVGYSGCALQLFGESDEVWSFPSNDADCQAGLLFNPTVPDGASITRRSVVVEHGLGFRKEWPRVGGDWLYQLDLSTVTRFGNLPEKLLYYRQGPQNVTSKSSSIGPRREMVRLGLGKLGVDPTPERVELHLLLTRIAVRLPDAAMVRSAKAHIDELTLAYERRGLAAAHHFQRVAQERWRNLLYTVEEGGWGPLLAYARLNRGLPWGTWAYLLRSRSAAFLKRSVRK
jgi:glycosyltransferase involved in cell wall biosynthesis